MSQVSRIIVPDANGETHTIVTIPFRNNIYPSTSEEISAQLLAHLEKPRGKRRSAPRGRRGDGARGAGDIREVVERRPGDFPLEEMTTAVANPKHQDSKRNIDPAAPVLVDGKPPAVPPTLGRMDPVVDGKPPAVPPALDRMDPVVDGKPPAVPPALGRMDPVVDGKPPAVPPALGRVDPVVDGKPALGGRMDPVVDRKPALGDRMDPVVDRKPASQVKPAVANPKHPVSPPVSSRHVKAAAPVVVKAAVPLAPSRQVKVADPNPPASPMDSSRRMKPAPLVVDLDPPTPLMAVNQNRLKIPGIKPPVAPPRKRSSRPIPAVDPPPEERGRAREPKADRQHRSKSHGLTDAKKPIPSNRSKSQTVRAQKPHPSKAYQSRIKIRPGTLVDLPRLADIAAYGFRSSPHVNACFPRINKFFDDYRRFVKGKIQGYLLDSAHRVLVAECKMGVCDVLMGFTVWERVGEGSEEVAAAKETPYHWIARASNSAARWTPANYDSSKDYDVCRRLEDARQWLEERYFSRYPERWHMRGVVVEEKHRGLGAGSKLVNWGVSLAEKEGIVAAVETAPDAGYADGFFRRIGFVRLGEFKPKIGGFDMGSPMLCSPPRKQ